MKTAHFLSFLLITCTLNTLTAQPPAQAAGLQTAGIVLDKDWQSPLQGNSVSMKELSSLLSPFFQPKAAIGEGFPIEIYQGVTFLMPLNQARGKLGISDRLSPKTKVATAGFPKDSFYSYVCTGMFDGDFDQMHIVVDGADQVVSIQLVCTSPKKTLFSIEQHQSYHTYNFVNNKTRAINTILVNHEVQYEEGNRTTSWRTFRDDSSNTPKNPQLVRIESQAISPNMGTHNPYYRGRVIETVRWYVPQPLAELIMFCARKNG